MDRQFKSKPFYYRLTEKLMLYLRIRSQKGRREIYLSNPYISGYEKELQRTLG